MAIVDPARLGRSVFACVAAVLLAMPAAAETAVKFSLDGKIEGPSAPFFLAIDKGFYRAEGLDVSIDPGAGPAEPINRLASGNYDLGIGDINSLIKMRDATPSMAVKAIFIVYDRPGYAIIARKSRVTQPKDLEGKKLGAPAADTAFAQWPIFVRANGIDAAKVIIEHVGLPVRDPMLAAGQLDAVTGTSFSTFIDLKDRGVPPDDLNVLLMADYGVELYGNAIMVNTKFAADKGAVVRAFLRATLRALKETVRDPRRAIESVLRRNDAAKKEVELERLRMAIHENILTPAVKANGYGGIDPTRLAKAIDQIALTYQFKAKDKERATEVFDDSFLPAAAERKAN